MKNLDKTINKLKNQKIEEHNDARTSNKIEKMSLDNHDPVQKPSTDNISMSKHNNVSPSKKYRTTIYLDESTKQQLNNMYIRHLQDNNKMGVSQLIRKAISEFYHNHY